MDKVIKSVLGFSSKSLANELTDIFSGDTSIASVSALVQQRTKILPTAFEEVFKQFTNTMNPVKQFEGYRLLAVDGSDIHTPTNPDDYDSYFKVKNCSPYNLYHLNALYDLCSNTYLDAVIQKTRKCNEHRALCDMVDRYNSPVPSVFIADRGSNHLRERIRAVGSAYDFVHLNQIVKSLLTVGGFVSFDFISDFGSIERDRAFHSVFSASSSISLITRFTYAFTADCRSESLRDKNSIALSAGRFFYCPLLTVKGSRATFFTFLHEKQPSAF